MSSPNFKRPVAPPAAPVGQLPQFAGGQLPLRPAEVYVSDDMARQLKAIGCDPSKGDPVPVGLPDMVEQVRRKFAGEKAVADAQVAAIGATQRIKQPPPVDISTLPPEAIAELTEFMDQAKAYQKQQKTAGNMHPSVAAASQQVASMAKAKPETEFVVQTSPSFAQPKPVPPLAAAPVAETQIEFTPPPAPEPPAAEPAATTEAGAGSVDHICQQCGYDNRIALNVEPSQEDIRAFVVAILSGDRFYKQISLMGNRLFVLFRTLTSQESETVMTQLRYDVENGEIDTQGEFLARMADYRMVLGIAKITRADGSVMTEIQPMKDIPYENPTPEKKQTVLWPLRQWLLNTGITQEELRRIIGREHRNFQRLHEALEARTADPNFWNGIE